MHMPIEATAQAAAADANEDEYQALCAALSASARGRAFLEEYARRHRAQDSERVLAAIARLEALIRTQRADSASIHGELQTLLATIRLARPDIEASSLAARAIKLLQLLDLLQRRLEALAGSAPLPGGEGRLSVVPPAEEPELPIPSPQTEQPVLSLAIDRSVLPDAAHNVAACMPEITWVESQAPEPANVEPVQSAQWREPTAPKSDPLAPLMLLSEEERIALFT
jgi:hypothetical protein